MDTTVIKLIEVRGAQTKISFFTKVIRYSIKLIFFWIPKANPDFEGLFDSVKYWFVEVDNTTGRAEREIGFSGLNKPIVFAPTNRNLGMWTDSDRVFTLSDYQQVDDIEFDKLWNYIRENKGVDF